MFFVLSQRDEEEFSPPHRVSSTFSTRQGGIIPSSSCLFLLSSFAMRRGGVIPSSSCFFYFLNAAGRSYPLIVFFLHSQRDEGEVACPLFFFLFSCCFFFCNDFIVL